MNIEPTEEQRIAIEDILYGKEKYLVIKGRAGTGKSTVIAEVHKKDNYGSIIYAATTHKAKDRLIKEGIPAAATVHSVVYGYPIYKQIYSDYQNFWRCNYRSDVAPAYEEWPALIKGIGLKNRLDVIVECLKVYREYINKTAAEGENRLESTAFRLINKRLGIESSQYIDRWESINTRTKTLVVDEASMMGEELHKEILRGSFRRVVFIGDDFQLPPVNDGDVFRDMIPDIELMQQHRHGHNSELLDLINAIRDYSPINLRDYPNVVKFIGTPLVNVPCITFLNDTRRRLIKHMRSLLGYPAHVVVVGDTLICKQTIKPALSIIGSMFNVASLKQPVRFYNGAMVVVKRVDEDETLTIEKERGTSTSGISICNSLLPANKKDIATKFEFGNVITVHGAQGSEYDDVQIPYVDIIWYREKAVDDTAFRRWFYTACTRAKRHIYIIGNTIQQPIMSNFDRAILRYHKGY